MSEKVEEVEVHHDEKEQNEAKAGDSSTGFNNRARRERVLLRKQDLIILPLMSMSYMFSYLDRAQIGNARIMGLEKSLGLSDSQFYNCLMIYFVGFCLAEFPAALLLQKVSANWLYGSAVILFGVVTALLSVSGGYAGLMILRFLLGVGEAVVTTGFLYLNLWYKRDELAWRGGIFFASSAIGAMASGIIAWGTAKNMEGHDGLHSWQWLFLATGLPTIGLGIALCIFLPSLPDEVAHKSHFLFRSPDERDLIFQRLLESQNNADVKIVPRQILAGLKDIKTWLGALLLGGVCLANTAFVIFLPTFVKEFGYSALVTQLYTMIPYAFAVVFTPIMCYLSDRFNSRTWPTMLCLGSCVLGLILLLTTTNQVALMAACCFVASGSTPAVPITAAWITNIHGGYTKKSTMFTINMFFVEGYAIISTQIYDTPPRFLKGHGVVLALVGVSVLSAALLYLHMDRENKARDAISKDFAERGETHPLASKTLEEVYDFHPDFRYPL